MYSRIKEVIKIKVKPYLESHGGDIEFISIVNGIAKVRLLGNCSGCPGARVTIEEIVKAALVQEFPEIKDVELENQISQDVIDLAKKILNKSS